MKNPITSEIASLGKELRAMIRNYSQKEIRLGRLTAARGKLMILQNSETSSPVLSLAEYDSKLLQILKEISVLTEEMAVLLPELQSKSLELQAEMILAGELNDFVDNAVLTTA